MTDFEARRRMMVDTQVRPSDVTRFPIIDAMLTVPREDFVPDTFRETAYAGEHIPLSKDRVIFDGRLLAKILDALDLTGHDLVLDIGSAYGYSAAVIAHIAQAVVAVEGDEALATESQTLLSDAHADNVVVEQGDMTAGAPQHGPYDVIVIEGGVEVVPPAILDQLKEGGRIAAVFCEGQLGRLCVGHKHNGKVNWREEFNAGVPVMPGFAREAAFSL